MPEILPSLMNRFLLIFIICSMLAMGLSLTIQQIAAPLKNGINDKVGSVIHSGSVIGR